jgi:Recombinational DNA repair protein (RecF pathway)
MENTVTKISETAGLAPGTPVPVGIDESAPSKFVIFIISNEGITSERVGTLPDVLPEHPLGSTMWIDVQGYAGLSSIRKIFDFLKIHPLFQEDILNTRQRAKYEILDGALLVTTKRLFYAANGRIHQEQVVFLLKDDCLVTFQPATGDSFEGFRKRLPSLKGNKTLPGYIVYALLDNLVDNYFVIIEKLQASLEKTEKRLLANDTALERGVLSGLKHVLDMPSEDVRELADALISAKEQIRLCACCFDLCDSDLCDICRDKTRDRTVVCVIEQPQDLMAMERSRGYKGLYHVLHDSIFNANCNGPVTVLVAKDRVLAHNPLGAVYSRYWQKKLKINDPDKV